MRRYIDLRCTNSFLRNLLIEKLGPTWVVTTNYPELVVVIDQPVGSAAELISPNHLNQYVLTNNVSLVYRQYLTHLGVQVLNLDAIAVEALTTFVEREHDGKQCSLPLLPESELLILHYTASGQSNKQIARCLGVTEVAVKNTLYKVFRRLGIRNRVEAALLYYGIVPTNLKTTQPLGGVA